jgi:hypothetical protein
MILGIRMRLKACSGYDVDFMVFLNTDPIEVDILELKGQIE